MQLKSAIPLDASMDPKGAQLLETSQLPKNEQDRISAWVIPRKRTKQHLGESGDGDGDRVAKELSEYPYAKILNNLLPPEIRVLGWAPVSDEFSARFSASTRTYRYFFVQRKLNLERMQQGLDLMVGKHDFRNFCKMDVEKVYNFERVIHAAELVDPMVERNRGASDRICFVQIHGQAFLWHQIRCIMEILFMIGNGSEEPSVITELFDIEKNPGKPNYPLAPEMPLVLKDCGYPNLQFGYSVQNIWSVMCQLEQQWEELALAAARIRDGIDGLRDVYVLKDDLLEFATAKVMERRRKLEKSSIDVSCEVDESGLSGSLPQSSTFVSWEQSLLWLSNECNLIPDSNGLNTSIHIPLLRRSRGTTYDQKITALKKSDKRRIKYEEGVVKKRKTAEEDAAFYSHMTKQGGTGI
jgi:tRNA pseudouridine38/39 synthase